MNKKGKVWKEEGIKIAGRTEKNNEFRGKGEKKNSSVGFKLIMLVLLVFVCVKRDVVVGRIGFSFLPS